MRLTAHTDYALRVLVFLAVRRGERVSTGTIAEAYDISLHHLHKVVRSLGELGVVELHRGAGGGVELARAPEEISVGEIVRALDDDDMLVECFRVENDECVISPVCALKGSLRRAEEAFYRQLDPVKLSVVVRGASRKLRELTSPPTD